MKKPPKHSLDLKFPDELEKYRHKNIENIVSALDFLRGEAKVSGSDEIYTLINSAFNTCFVIHAFLVSAGHISEQDNDPIPLKK